MRGPSIPSIWRCVFACAVVILTITAFRDGAASAESEADQDTTNWPQVISRLQQEIFQNPGQARMRQQLAIAYNNYGVNLGKQGQWALAIEQFEEALRLDGANQEIQKNFSNLYVAKAQQAYEQHQVEGAVAALEHAVNLNPGHAKAYAFLGEIEYNRQRLKEAQAAWQRSLQLDPSQSELAEHLRQVTEELPVESKFERRSQAYFDFRYEEDVKLPDGFDMGEVLLDARRSVGLDLAYWPKRKFVVLLYSAAQFRRLRQEVPDWVAGQFDGKIRVPIPDSKTDQGSVTQTVFHEYTHALIHDLTNGQCPLWLNEGLAEYEGREQLPGSLERLAKAHHENRLIPWAELSDHISTKGEAEDVAFAYEEAHSIASYLVTRYGFWRIRRMLKAIGEGQPWEGVLTEELHLKLPRIESDWKEWLPQLLAEPR